MRGRHTLSGSSLGAAPEGFTASHATITDQTAGAAVTAPASSSGGKTILILGGLAIVAGGIYMIVKKKR